MSRLSFLSLLNAIVVPVLGFQRHFSIYPNRTAQWDHLRHELQGRFYELTPLAAPCFSGDFNATACAEVKRGYLDEGTLNLFI